ncbi:IclR family transcriptional regulator [Amycolatopsis sp. NBRC 101858]|uniref:IclR family transcriptional regulator n=1 Tax=Amycolatopsis sp. NBRC 101858 TaxID=3032200 RepID=UPI0024A06759|nr:IclR family transcriptional regulator [Amycolatopsis sp. NBRC 101858]GLY38953.1 IclR family transcriptional regulator [Amycolatopsis sp. NBRC 101858]
MTESPAGMVDRVVLILGVFERSGGKLTLGQVSSRSGLPRSSAHRILQQLVDARLLYRMDNTYTLGLRMFEIGSLVVGRSRLLEVARRQLQELAVRTGLVAHLALLEGQDALYLEKVGGAFTSVPPTRVGGRLPAHCTGVGKALLAFSPQTVVDDYLSQNLRQRTVASISSPAALETALQRVRESGYAVDREESARGVACVAAPILEGGSVIAAVSLCGPRARVVVDDLRYRVMWTAAEISRQAAPGGHRTGCSGQRKMVERLRPEPETITA